MITKEYDIPLECFVDYIVGVDDQIVDGNLSLSHMLANVTGPSCDLRIYNVLQNRSRRFTIMRTGYEPFCLSLSVRYEYFRDALENVLLVASLRSGYPGDVAGLKTNEYIIGFEDGRSATSVKPIMEWLVDKPQAYPNGFGVYVYNPSLMSVRLLTLFPREHRDHLSIGAELVAATLPLPQTHNANERIGVTNFQEIKIETSTQTEPLMAELAN